jgi:carbonyl reductase 1
MSSHKGHLTPEQGAETILKVAIGNIGKQTGLFWENSKPSEW